MSYFRGKNNTYQELHIFRIYKSCHTNSHECAMIGAGMAVWQKYALPYWKCITTKGNCPQCGKFIWRLKPNFQRLFNVSHMSDVFPSLPNSYA